MEQSEHSVLEHLFHKLGDLEHKVRAYRHDRAVEFQGHYQHALQHVAASAVVAIERSIATSLSAYPALGPDLEQLLLVDQARQSPSPAEHKDTEDLDLAWADSQPPHLAPTSAGPPADTDQLQQQHSRRSPPPPGAAGAVFGAPVIAPSSPTTPGSLSSPHEREKEFQGLFTPFFLPLLDSSPQLPSSPPSSLPASPLLDEPLVAGTGVESGLAAHVAAAPDNLQGSSQHLQGHDMESAEPPTESNTGARPSTPQASSASASAPSLSPVRPGSLTRRSTEDTTSSSAFSDRGDTKVRRSALRRSLNSARTPLQSPRRVRFEFKGAEVLPTASPQPSDFATLRPPSPVPPDQPRSFDEIVGENSGGDRGSVGRELPPRKISSSEALRALSRAPLDQETVWTVVNSGSDEAAPSDSADSPQPLAGMSTTRTAPAPPSTMPSQGLGARQLTVNTMGTADEDAGSDVSSDEDFLSMAKPRSFEGKTSLRSSSLSHPSKNDTEPAEPAQLAVSKGADEEKDHTSSEDFEDEEDMFHFETGGLSAPPRPKSKPKPPPLQDDHVEPPEPASYGRASDPAPRQPLSPAVPISRPFGSSASSTPTTSKFQPGSLGSYRGRPLVMPVVKNPDVLAQAASLGEFNTFVGGLDGRSGIDEGDLSSFRASVVQGGFSGTPRSLTERMMMEDAQNGGQNGR